MIKYPLALDRCRKCNCKWNAVTICSAYSVSSNSPFFPFFFRVCRLRHPRCFVLAADGEQSSTFTPPIECCRAGTGTVGAVPVYRLAHAGSRSDFIAISTRNARMWRARPLTGVTGRPVNTGDDPLDHLFFFFILFFYFLFFY